MLQDSIVYNQLGRPQPYTYRTFIVTPARPMSSTQTHVEILELSQEELACKKLSSHTLQAAVEALHLDGLVVLKNAVDVAHLDKLNERMVAEAKILYKQKTTARNFGASTGNIQQEPPVDKDYIFEDIIANPWATEVVECMIGPNPMLRFFSANTAFKAKGRQPVHIDVDFDMPKVPFGYCININLVDTSPKNGSTEIWLGTHTQTDIDVLDPEEYRVRPDLVEARRRISPPIQPTLSKGSLIIRDFRLWHAGMPNQTDEPRVMVVTVQFPKWYRNDTKVILPRSLEGKINWGGLVPCVEWVEDGYDYLKGAHTHDFSLKP